MNHTEILALLAGALDATNYLEIGVRNPADNLELIPAKNRIGVDPRIGASMGETDKLLRMTSDEFFAGRKKTDAPFDLVFIDGDHSHEQSLADLNNALHHLAPGGVIVMHDTLPATAEAATPTKPNNSRPWNGQVYKTALKARKMKSVVVVTIDTDHGCTLIRKKSKAHTAYKPLPANTKVDVPFDQFDRTTLNLVPAKDVPSTIAWLTGGDA